MTSSYCLSSTRNNTLIKPQAFHIHKHRPSSFSHETLVLKPNPSLHKSSISLLRLKNYKFAHPFATLSSFAEGEDEQGCEIKAQQQQHKENEKSDEVFGGGMAQAFNISSNTASAISICIALAALALPFFMNSLGQGLPLKTKLLSYATLLFGFYMAWNIGANDVANAMGTSVGSGALTLRQAVLTAAVLEFSGALLMGTHVTSTMQKGILVANVFQGKDTLLFAGLLSSLAAAGTWLQVRFNFLCF